MTSADFYLFCFFFGFFFSVVAVLSGHLHLPGHGGDAGHGHGLDFNHGNGVDAGHGHGMHGHGMHGHAQGTAGGAHGHAAGSGSHAHSHSNGAGEHSTRIVSPFNLATISAFLAWFGGAGYLSTQVYRLWFVFAFGLACVCGFAGAGALYWFLAKVFMREREEMDPAQYDMVGVLGKVSGAIRPGGIGEVFYSRDGALRSVAARSEDGVSIPQGVEVVVTRYDDGVAYVKRWDDFSGAATQTRAFEP